MVLAGFHMQGKLLSNYFVCCVFLIVRREIDWIAFSYNVTSFEHCDLFLCGTEI